VEIISHHHSIGALQSQGYCQQKAWAAIGAHGMGGIRVGRSGGESVAAAAAAGGGGGVAAAAGGGVVAALAAGGGVKRVNYWENKKNDGDYDKDVDEDEDEDEDEGEDEDTTRHQ